MDIEFYKSLADKGSNAGLIYMGYCYLHGDRVEQNYPEAHRLLSLAHQKGALTGTFLLGTMYEDGLSIQQDIHYAIELYEQAAQIDLLYALLHLARIYRNGNGVPVDFSLAKYWYGRIMAIAEEVDSTAEEVTEARDFIAVQS
jgi:TPR repeat protein